MLPQIVQLPAIRIISIHHRGSYDGVSQVFDQLFEWVEAEQVPVQRTIGIYWDNPDYVATWRLRSAACVEVPEDFMFVNRTRMPLQDERIAAGSYVTTRFVGPYEDLAPVWSNLAQVIEGSMGRRISSNPAFEVYVNDASTTPPQELITDLYMPIL